MEQKDDMASFPEELIGNEDAMAYYGLLKPFLELHINNDNLKTVTADTAIAIYDILEKHNKVHFWDDSDAQKEVEDAAKQIGVHDFIMTLPGAYQYNVKERGAMLSSGQRQLIAFLRAYLSQPSILILDEATSSVDSYAERLIQYATETITKGRTSIIIAHRLATIKQADKIIVMDKGRIVEEGTHDELLQRDNGYYKNLYDKQFGTKKAS